MIIISLIFPCRKISRTHTRFGLLALCSRNWRFRLIRQRPRIRTENATSPSTLSALLGCPNLRASHFACTGRVNIACIKVCVCVARVNHVTSKHKLTPLEQIKVIEHYKLKQILSMTVIRTRHFSYVHRKGVQLTYVLSSQHWSRGDPHFKFKHAS